MADPPAVDPVAILQYAAHDLKNLLATIRGNVELAMRVHREDRAVTFLKSAVQASEHANELLLSLPHLLEDQVRREELVDLHTLIEGIANYTLPPRGIIFTVTLPESPWLIHGVRKDLGRALTNLFINACEAADSNKEEPPQISIEGENVMESADESMSPQPYVCITVTDNGVGMSEARMNRLFKGETSKGRLGSGLGLLSTLNIVMEHSGFMEITSTEGEGTSFKIFLPKAS